MEKLTLELLDGGADEGAGRYADIRALEILKRHLQNLISTQDAAKEILAMLPESQYDKSRPREFNHLSSFLLSMAQQIPYSDPGQARLVNLVQRLSQSPKLSGQAATSEGKLCFTMLDFKGLLGEWGIPSLEEDPEDAEQCAHALNLAAFLARLTQRGFVSYEDFTIQMMRESLERKIDDNQEVHDTMVSAGALWIIFAGQTTYTEVVEAPVPPSQALEKLHEAGPLYNGPILGRERWSFWKKALAAATERTGVGAECQRLAGVAVELMKVIEESMKF